MCGEKEVCSGWISTSYTLKAHDYLFPANVLAVPPLGCTWPLAGVLYSWLSISVVCKVYNYKLIREYVDLIRCFTMLPKENKAKLRAEGTGCQCHSWR